MNENHDSLAAYLSRMGRNFPYPPTPDFSGGGSARPAARGTPLRKQFKTWSVAAGLILMLLLASLAVPQVRAAVESWLQIGVVRIFFEQDEAGPGYTPLPAFQELSGRTTLETAQQQAGFLVPLPPMRPPEHVFFQELGGPVVLCIWSAGEEIELSLMVLGPGAHLGKSAPETMFESSVDGIRTVWLAGEHNLYMRSEPGMQNFLLPVGTNVLLWDENNLTFRLAAEFSYEQAVELMRSLRR